MAKKTILVVEDEKDMQAIYKDLLEDQYKVLQAFDTKEAMAKLKKHKVDLIILDVIMPRETGDTFFVHMRQMPEFKKIKVIVATVLGDLGPQFRRIDPVVVCLGKPFEKGVLLDIIKKSIEGK